MTEDTISLLKKCSPGNKQKLREFLMTLYTPEGSENSTVENQLQIIFNKITRQFSLSKVREISKVERNEKNLTNYQYSYGQITFRTIFTIIEKIKKLKQMSRNEVFYDLGSGSGKVLFAASLCYPFAKCKGIQYLQTLYGISMNLKKTIEAEKKMIEENVCEITGQTYEFPSMQIYNENFQKLNWSDGTVIFVSSTCYTRQMMYRIEELCEKLPGGTILITLTRSIENHNKGWRLLEKFQGKTSWAQTTVFIHVREH